MLQFYLVEIGATNRNTSPDGQTSLSHSNVLAAAQTLAMILQQSGNMAPSPDPITASIINTWLETHLPVSSNIILIFGNKLLLLIQDIRDIPRIVYNNDLSIISD